MRFDTAGTISRASAPCWLADVVSPGRPRSNIGAFAWTLLERCEHAHDIQFAIVGIDPALEFAGPLVIDDDADRAGSVDGLPFVPREEAVEQHSDRNEHKDSVRQQLFLQQVTSKLLLGYGRAAQRAVGRSLIPVDLMTARACISEVLCRVGCLFLVLRARRRQRLETGLAHIRRELLEIRLLRRHRLAVLTQAPGREQ